MRIKIMGYIEVEELDDEYLDLEDPTGLSKEGYDQIVRDVDGNWSIDDLVDVEVELVP
jgi:hypothetical protein